MQKCSKLLLQRWYLEVVLPSTNNFITDRHFILYIQPKLSLSWLFDKKPYHYTILIFT